MKEKWIKVEGGERYVKIDSEYTQIEIDKIIEMGKPCTYVVSVWHRDLRSRIKITNERESKEETQKILDKFMTFFADDDFDIIDMDVIAELAREPYLTNKGERETNTVEAWKHVYNELIKCPLFIGVYDAKNSNEHFEYGIEAVMEVIAEKAGCHCEYEQMMLENIAESKKK